MIMKNSEDILCENIKDLEIFDENLNYLSLFDTEIDTIDISNTKIKNILINNLRTDNKELNKLLEEFEKRYIVCNLEGFINFVRKKERNYEWSKEKEEEIEEKIRNDLDFNEYYKLENKLLNRVKNFFIKKFKKQQEDFKEKVLEKGTIDDNEEELRIAKLVGVKL